MDGAALAGGWGCLGQFPCTVNVTTLSSSNVQYRTILAFPSEHEGFKSSRLDSYNKFGGVFVVAFQTAPHEAFVISQKWYRKLILVEPTPWLGSVRLLGPAGLGCAGLLWRKHI